MDPTSLRRTLATRVDPVREAHDFSADIVTADGKMLVANENENADIFWAIRGGGGNFGVVTSFEYNVQPVDTVYWGPMFYEIEYPQILPGLHQGRTASDGRFPGFPDRAAATVHSRGPTREHVLCNRCLLVRRPRRGRASVQAVP